MRTVKIYQNAEQAALEKSRLDAAGIRCVLFDENTYGLLSTAALVGIRLVVADEDYEAASAILEETEAVEPLPDDFIPPPGPEEKRPGDEEEPAGEKSGEAERPGGCWTFLIGGFGMIALLGAASLLFGAALVVLKFSLPALLLAFAIGGFLWLVINDRRR